MVSFTDRPRWTAISRLVAGGMSIRAAADELRVSKSTAYSWTRQPEFRTEVARLRGEIAEEGAAKMRALLAKASERIDKLLDSSDETVQWRAASTVIQHSLKHGQDLATELQRATDLLDRQQRLSEIPGSDSAEAVGECLRMALDAIDETMREELPEGKARRILNTAYARIEQSVRTCKEQRLESVEP
jgi:transposase